MDKILLTIKYVDGDLSEVEHRAFEDAMKTDGELAEYFSYYKQINREIKSHLTEVLVGPVRNKIESEAAFVHEKLTYGLDRLWFFGWVIAIVVALFVWKPWKVDLFEEFGFDNKTIAANLVNVPHKGLNEAVGYLAQKDYYEAKRIVAKSFVQNPDDFKLVKAYAMLLIADGCLETGREILYPFAKKNSVYEHDAAYMLAISYLKSGDIENCRHWLKKIGSQSIYYDQSLQLLNKLDLEAEQPNLI